QPSDGPTRAGRLHRPRRLPLGDAGALRRPRRQQVPAVPASGEVCRGGLARPQDEPRLLRLQRPRPDPDPLRASLRGHRHLRTSPIITRLRLREARRAAAIQVTSTDAGGPWIAALLRSLASTAFSAGYCPVIEVSTVLIGGSSHSATPSLRATSRPWLSISTVVGRPRMPNARPTAPSGSR